MMSDSPNTIFFDNGRRVTKQMSLVHPEHSQTPLLMCCDSLYAAGTMDGKLKFLTLSSRGEGTMQMQRPGIETRESHYIETTWGVCAAQFFKFENSGGCQEFVVLGYEDGSIHVYDYTRFNTQSFKKLVFSTSSQSPNSDEPLSTVEERFCDTKYKHSGAIVDIEVNPIDPATFLTSSQDGSVIVWRFATEMQNGVQIVPSPRIDADEVITQVKTLHPRTFKVGSHSKTYPVCGCRWLDQLSIAVGLQSGQVRIASGDPSVT